MSILKAPPPLTKNYLSLDIRAFFQLARPHQYVKNLLLLLPLFFSGNLFNIALLLTTALGFIGFSLCASAVYVFNDLQDRAYDAQHPVKRRRPIASGRVTSRAATLFFGILLTAGFTISYPLSTSSTLVLLAYVSMNIAYSLGLKHVALLDVFLIATGFVLRLWYGALISSVVLSQWIVVMTFLLALFLALAKRRDDVLLFIKSGTKTRKVVDGYNQQFLDAALGLMAGVTLVAYIMYTLSDRAKQAFGTENLYLTFAFVLLGILRYLQITLVEERSGSPTSIFLHDTMLRIVVGGWVVLFLGLIYLK